MATRASNRAAIQEATETRCEYGLGWDRPNPQDVLAAPNRKAEEQGREVVGGRRKLEPEKPPDDQDFSAPAIEQRQQQKEAADEAAARREEADAEALYLEEWERREAAEAELTLARTRSAEKNQLLSAAKANLASLQAKAKIDKPPSGTLYLPRRFAVLAVARCKPASFVVVWGAYVRSVALSPCRPVALCLSACAAAAAAAAGTVACAATCVRWSTNGRCSGRPGEKAPGQEKEARPAESVRGAQER